MTSFAEMLGPRSPQPNPTNPADAGDFVGMNTPHAPGPMGPGQEDAAQLKQWLMDPVTQRMLPMALKLMNQMPEPSGMDNSNMAAENPNPPMPQNPY